MKFKHNLFFVDTSRGCWYEETVPWVLFEMWVQCILVHVIKLHPSQNQLKQNKEPQKISSFVKISDLDELKFDAQLVI